MFKRLDPKVADSLALIDEQMETIQLLHTDWYLDAEKMREESPELPPASHWAERVAS